ncbi:hypothetical protein PR202_ga22642 [Eleusine coracana subsp. coracana]|uniref:Uncharacterized protein n=1 Tax=Eleusine coracana subsp. coracana TaxID=191504 RepID=A0AAV5D457_ELECO|nr:hypothetical protein PR202_ga22642 [Eleusine coracana subsp. coracana]
MVAAGASREQRWSLAGTTALVTGGSKEINYAIVEELAGFGARVHTCAGNAAELEECRRKWAEKGLHVTVSVCDVAVPVDREVLMDTVKATFDGKLDILLARPLLRDASLAGGGSVVNVSSISSYIGFPGLTVYDITKGNAESTDQDKGSSLQRMPEAEEQTVTNPSGEVVASEDPVVPEEPLAEHFPLLPHLLQLVVLRVHALPS